MKSVPVENILKFRGPVRPVPRIPQELCDELHKFLLDRYSGNMILNIRDGAVLGFRLERQHTFRPESG